LFTYISLTSEVTNLRRAPGILWDFEDKPHGFGNEKWLWRETERERIESEEEY
jgi:hypothetical protein